MTEEERAQVLAHLRGAENWRCGFCQAMGEGGGAALDAHWKAHGAAPYRSGLEWQRREDALVAAAQAALASLLEPTKGQAETLKLLRAALKLVEGKP